MSIGPWGNIAGGGLGGEEGKFTMQKENESSEKQIEDQSSNGQ